VRPEGGEHLVVVAHLFEECVRDCLLVVGFGDAACCCLVEQAERFPEDVCLDVVLDIEPSEDFLQAASQRLRAEGDPMFCGVGEPTAASATMAVQSIQLCGEGLIYSAPPSGANPKKVFRRLEIVPWSPEGA
jgi:hypothetical protein